MSGGSFDYIQYRFPEIIESIQNELDVDDKCFSNETLKEFEHAIELLKRCQVYVTRIDYLLAGDDGEETFHERLKEDLQKDEKNNL